MNNTNTQISRKKQRMRKEAQLSLRRLTKLCFLPKFGRLDVQAILNIAYY